MNSAQRVNPAPALYAAAVAVVAYGLVSSCFEWIGSSPPGSGIALGSALASVAAAAVALALFSRDFRPMLAIVAISGTIIALDVAIAAGAGVMNFPGSNSERIAIGHLIFFGVAFAVSAVIAGLAGLGAVAANRRCFTNTGPYYTVIWVVVINAVIVSAGSAFYGLLPDQEFKLGAGLVYVDRSAFYGLGDDIGMVAGVTVILLTNFPVTCVSIATFASATAVLRRYSNDRINRIVSVTAIGISIIAAIVATLSAAIHVTYVVADANAYHASWGQGLDIASAVVAGVVATLGCIITAGIASVVAWRYRSLRGR